MNDHKAYDEFQIHVQYTKHDSQLHLTENSNENDLDSHSNNDGAFEINDREDVPPVVVGNKD